MFCNVLPAADLSTKTATFNTLFQMPGPFNRAPLCLIWEGKGREKNSKFKIQNSKLSLLLKHNLNTLTEIPFVVPRCFNS